MKRLLFILFPLLLILGCAPTQPSATAETQAKKGTTDKEVHVIAPMTQSSVLAAIEKRGKMLVGTSGDQAPFTMQDRAGNLMGLEIELVRAFAASLEIEVEFVQMPFGELLEAVESHKIDMALSSITMTPKRNLDVGFVGPYFVSGKALLTKDENLAEIEKPGELDKMQMRLGALKGSTSELLIKKAAPRAALTSFETYDEAVEAVAGNKVNAIIADLPLVAVTLLRHPDAGFAAIGSPLSFEPIGVAVPAGDAHFHNLVTNYISLIEGMGALEALRERWFGTADWLTNLPEDDVEKKATSKKTKYSM